MLSAAKSVVSVVAYSESCRHAGLAGQCYAVRLGDHAMVVTAAALITI